MINNEMAAGVAIGVGLGILAGFLLAPRPGRETRQILKEKFEDTGHKVAEAIYNAKEAVGARLLGQPE